MNDVTFINRDSDPNWYADQMGQDLFLKSQLYGPDYWQQVLVSLHERLADELLDDTFGMRSDTKLERLILNRHFKKLASQYAEPTKLALKVDTNPFGLCPICRQSDGYLNIGRAHWGYCAKDQTRWPIGSNMFSSWQHEDEAVWERNAAKLGGYTLVEPWYGSDDSPLND